MPSLQQAFLPNKMSKFRNSALRFGGLNLETIHRVGVFKFQILTTATAIFSKWVICWWNKARPRTTEVLLNTDTLVQDFRARGVWWWHQLKEGLAYKYVVVLNMYHT